MDIQRVELYLLTNQKYFPSEKFLVLKEKLSTLDEMQFSNLHLLELRNPLIVLIVSIFLGNLGIDRFMLQDITHGILKLVTFGGLGIWTLIDWILITDKTKQYNLDKVMNFVDGKYY